MMTSPSTTKTARQVFGEALKFYREQRDFNHARVADICKVSRSDVEAWEAGRTVPDSKAWELLKKMVHRGLASISNVRQQALSEADAERAMLQRSMQRGQPPSKQQQPADKPLTTRPFAEALAKVPVLSIVPPPKPEPVAPPAPPPAPAPPPITTPAGVPATLIGETFDLTDAYTAVSTLPDGWGTSEAKNARSAFAKQLLIEGLDPEIIVARTREKFTVGISRVTLKKLRVEIEKEAAKAERKAQREAAKAAPALDVEVSAPPPPPTPAPAPPVLDDAPLIAHARMLLAKSPSMKIDDLVAHLQATFRRSLLARDLYPLRDEAKAAWAKKAEALRETSPMPTPPAPAPVVAPATASNSDIETAAQLVLSAIPNLRTFTITVDDAGEVTVSHTVRVEASATIKLKR
jgi:DNA-binding transcriptional regulator YiaG